MILLRIARSQPVAIKPILLVRCLDTETICGGAAPRGSSWGGGRKNVYGLDMERAQHMPFFFGGGVVLQTWTHVLDF